MKEIFRVLAFSTALLGSTALSGSAAFAGQSDDLVARLNTAEQENAAMRRKSAELATAKPEKPASISDRMADFFGAYAADLPVAYKARPVVEPGRLTIWGEGGAIWTGGDQVAATANLIDFTTVGSGNSLAKPLGAASSTSSLRGSIPSLFDLNPKVGWTAATGFDYKFDSSPWHVSGQFRYGQSGQASGSAFSSGLRDPFFQGSASVRSQRLTFREMVIASQLGGSQSQSVTYKERHWLGDLALGYDIVSGPSYVQVKTGLRIAEMVGSYASNSNQNNFVNYSTPPDSYTARTNLIRTGPLIGLEAQRGSLVRGHSTTKAT